MSKLMFRGQGEVRGIFKKTDKQTIQLILIKQAKLEVISAFFFALKQTLSLARNTIQSFIRGYAVVQYFLTISQFFFLNCALKIKILISGIEQDGTEILLYSTDV